MTQVAVFDLDDTLYPERSFVASGFRAVSRYVCDTFGSASFFEVAWSLFEEGVRGRIFDLALERAGIPPSPASIEQLVQVYRFHTPVISLYPDAEYALEKLSARYSLALITDGVAEVQEGKLRALELENIFDPCIVTDRRGPGWEKPSIKAFSEIQEHFGLRGTEFVYIADNPQKDFVAPNILEWMTVRVLRKGGLYSHSMPQSEAAVPDYVIDSLDQLPRILGIAEL